MNCWKNSIRGLIHNLKLVTQFLLENLLTEVICESPRWNMINLAWKCIRIHFCSPVTFSLSFILFNIIDHYLSIMKSLPNEEHCEEYLLPFDIHYLIIYLGLTFRRNSPFIISGLEGHLRIWKAASGRVITLGLRFSCSSGNNFYQLAFRPSYINSAKNSPNWGVTSLQNALFIASRMLPYHSSHKLLKFQGG